MSSPRSAPAQRFDEHSALRVIVGTAIDPGRRGRSPTDTQQCTGDGIGLRVEADPADQAATEGRILAGSEALGSVLPARSRSVTNSGGLRPQPCGPLGPREPSHVDRTRSAGARRISAIPADVTIPAAVLAAVLFLGMAAFQVSLAFGAPLGAHVLGGRSQGRLPSRLRVFSAIAAAILVGGALVILARAGAIGWPAGAMGLLAPASWVIAAFLVLNTLGNLASRSRLERTVFAATTAALAALSAFVALS